MTIHKFAKQLCLLAALWLGACGHAPAASDPTLGGKTPMQTFTNPLDAELITAAIKGDSAEVGRLVKQGASVNAIAADGATPLMWASHTDSLVGMKLLLDVGANPNLRVPQLKGFAIIEGAAGGSSPEQLVLLLAHGGDPNLPVSPRVAGGSLLGVAATQGQLENVKLLVKAGADVNFHTDQNFDSPISEAIGSGSYDIVLYLLEHGYTYRLDEVAGGTQSRQVSADREPDRQKVIQWLLAHGVKYPAYVEHREQ